MAMGRQKQEHQEALFVTADELPRNGRHEELRSGNHIRIPLTQHGSVFSRAPTSTNCRD